MTCINFDEVKKIMQSFLHPVIHVPLPMAFITMKCVKMKIPFITLHTSLCVNNKTLGVHGIKPMDT
jgi:hypothetical protein